MSDTWYYAQGDQQHGPVSLEQLQALVAQGTLLPTDLVWREGMANWAPLASVAGPFAAGPAPVSVQQPIPLPDASPLQYYAAHSPENVEYGGFWIRLLAYIIDGIILFIPGTALSLVVGLAVPHASFRRSSLAWTFLPDDFVGVVRLIMGWLYFALMESSSTQATLGKMALGLVVTDAFGNRLSFGRATGRYFAKIISALIIYIGFIMAAFTDRKRALHDMIASTLVIRKNPSRVEYAGSPVKTQTPVGAGSRA